MSTRSPQGSMQVPQQSRSRSQRFLGRNLMSRANAWLLDIGSGSLAPETKPTTKVQRKKNKKKKQLGPKQRDMYRIVSTVDIDSLAGETLESGEDADILQESFIFVKLDAPDGTESNENANSITESRPRLQSRKSAIWRKCKGTRTSESRSSIFRSLSTRRPGNQDVRLQKKKSLKSALKTKYRKSRSHKAVRFFDDVQMRESNFILNSIIMNDMWYSEEEQLKIDHDNNLVILAMEEGIETKGDTTRGLEMHTKHGKCERSKNKKTGFEIVLDEQDRQWESGIDDKNRIAELSFKATSNCRKQATIRGLKDAKVLF